MVCIVSQNEIKSLVNTTHDSYPGNELKIPINKKKIKITDETSDLAF